MEAQEYKLQLAEIAGTWTAAIAVIIGGLFGVFQYLEHKSAVRVDRTMAFVERYNSDGLLMQARLKLSNSITNRVDEMNELLTDPSIKPEQLMSRFDAKVLEIVKEDELSGALDQILTFYEQIILCRDLNLCDSDVAQQFFDIDGKSFIRLYYPYVCKIREQWNNPKKFEPVLSFYLANLDNVCAQ